MLCAGSSLGDFNKEKQDAVGSDLALCGDSRVDGARREGDVGRGAFAFSGGSGEPPFGSGPLTPWSINTSST
jgi:hypothetical protein